MSGAGEPGEDSPLTQGRERGGTPSGSTGATFRFLLDADLSPRAAHVGRALGLDVLSVYECGRGELRDDEQLRLAAADGRLFVTRNRNDFLRWTAEFARTAEPHAGVLIALRSIPATRPEPLAHALRHWVTSWTAREGGATLGPYFVDFLAPAPID